MHFSEWTQILKVLFFTIYFFRFPNILLTVYYLYFGKEEEDAGSAGEQPVSNTLYGYTV
jgi:hypothetical protein